MVNFSYHELNKDDKIFFMLQHEFQLKLNMLKTIKKWLAYFNIEVTKLGNTDIFEESILIKLFSKKEITDLSNLYNTLIETSYYDNNKYVQLFEKNYNAADKHITYFSNFYPSKMQNIVNPPLSFFVRGEMFKIEKSAAIVGRRKASKSAVKLAFSTGYHLAINNYTIISGLASGIDTSGHKGALEAKGKTIAVFGTQINTVYPIENLELSKKIIKNGYCLSASTMETYQRNAKYFVYRNRLISSLSDFIIVVESNIKGGTIRQIEFSINQNKPVYYYVPINDEQKKTAEAVCQNFPKIIPFYSFEHLCELIELKNPSVKKLSSEQTKLNDFF